MQSIYQGLTVRGTFISFVSLNSDKIEFYDIEGFFYTGRILVDLRATNDFILKLIE